MSGSSSSPTVPGVSGATVTLSFTGSANVGLAQQIANALAQANTNNTLDVVSYTGGPIPAVTLSGATTEELLLAPTVSGSITVPAAASGVADILVVQNTQALTIHGSPGLDIIGGGPGFLDVIDPNIIVVGASIGATGSVAVTVTEADSPYQVGMGPGFETVTGQGTGSIDGGVGTNYIDVTAETGVNYVNLVGSGDTVLGGTTGGVATSVNASGYEGQVEGNAGPLFVTTSGYRTSVNGGAGALTVVDTGLRNTIQAGAGTATVTLDGSLGRTRGGTGNFTVLDLTANNTVIGATASSTLVTLTSAAAGAAVWGRAGNLTVLDNAANAEIGSGGGLANVTIGAANSQVYGGTGTLNVSIGAAGAVVAGLGANTIVDASSSLASGALVLGGFENTQSLDGSLSVLGGADQLLVVTGGSNATIDAATSDSVFTGIYIGTGSIAGNVLINGSASALQVNFIGGAGSATVLGGAGAATIFGVDGTDANFVGSTVSGAPGGFLFANGSSVGGETLSAANSTTNDTLFAAAGNDSLVAGSGNDVFFAGANTGSIGGSQTVTGGDTLAGGSGSDEMLFSKGSFLGAAIVTGFSSLDSAVFVGYNAAAGGNQAAIALANATVTGSGPTSDTTIVLADNTHITFVDTTVAQLQGHLSSS